MEVQILSAAPGPLSSCPTTAERRTTPLEEAYTQVRLDRQGLPVSPATLHLYEHTIGRFLRWVLV